MALNYIPGVFQAIIILTTCGSLLSGKWENPVNFLFFLNALVNSERSVIFFVLLLQSSAETPWGWSQVLFWTVTSQLALLMMLPALDHIMLGK